MLSEKPWKPERVVLFLLGTVVFFGWIQLAGGAVLHYSNRGKLDEHSLFFLLIGTMSIQGSILLAVAMTLWWFHVGWRDAFGFTRGDTVRAMVLGALAIAVFLPVALLLLNLSMEVITRMHPGAPIPTQQAVDVLQKTDSWGSRAYFVIFSIFIAPPAEEILFRGVLYPAVKQAGHPRTALWGTAVLFAVIHQDLPRFVPLMALGLALALLYEWTNNLLSCITAHSLFNALNIVVLFHQNSLQQLHK